MVFAAIIPVAPTTGASINPARTFGPMLVQQIAGGSVAWGQLPVYLAAEFLAGGARRAHLRRDLPHPRRRGTRRRRSMPPPTPAAQTPLQPEEHVHVKKLINDPADVVSEALRGIAAAHPELRVDHTNRIIYRGDAPVTGQGRAASRAAGPGTSRCTAASSARHARRRLRR